MHNSAGRRRRRRRRMSLFEVAFCLFLKSFRSQPDPNAAVLFTAVNLLESTLLRQFATFCCDKRHEKWKPNLHVQFVSWHDQRCLVTNPTWHVISLELSDDWVRRFYLRWYTKLLMRLSIGWKICVRLKVSLSVDIVLLEARMPRKRTWAGSATNTAEIESIFDQTMKIIATRVEHKSHDLTFLPAWCTSCLVKRNL